MYKITIKRLAKEGTLIFSSPGKTIAAKCYWNLTKKIPAGTYFNCSATTMARKRTLKEHLEKPYSYLMLLGFLTYLYIWENLLMKNGLMAALL